MADRLHSGAFPEVVALLDLGTCFKDPGGRGEKSHQTYGQKLWGSGPPPLAQGQDRGTEHRARSHGKVE